MSSEETAAKEPSTGDDTEALAREPEQQIPVQINGSSSNGDGTGSEVQGDEGSPAENDDDQQPTLESAAELMERGLEADRCNDLDEAVDCFSRALEIRVSHYGELAPECVYTYYRYGLALLYKAQKDTNLFSEVVAKKASNSSRSFSETDSAKIIEASSEAPMTTNGSDFKQDCVSSTNEEQVEEKGAGSNGQENHDKEAEDDGQGNQEGVDEDGDEDLNKAAEEDNDLDLAWKALDIARVIVERNPADTMEKVDILTALGDTSAEREDIETSLDDYRKALSILVNLVEPDSRRIAELHFKICLVLQMGDNIEDAIPCCQNAISVCEARLQRLKDELKDPKDLAATGVDMGSVNSSDQSVDQSDFSILEKEKEIQTLGGLLDDLREKMEDLKQMNSSPASPLTEIAQAIRAKAAAGREIGKSPILPSSSQIGMETGGVDLPTVSTAGTSSGGVTHLGVVGRGVKRATPVTAIAADPSPKRSPRSSVSEDLNSVDRKPKLPTE